MVLHRFHLAAPFSPPEMLRLIILLSNCSPHLSLVFFSAGTPSQAQTLPVEFSAKSATRAVLYVDNKWFTSHGYCYPLDLSVVPIYLTFLLLSL